jgi:hypothetical protein
MTKVILIVCMVVGGLGVGAYGELGQPKQGERLQLPPHDGGRAVPGFRPIEDALAKAVADKDAQAIVRLLAPSIVARDVTNEGPEAFRRSWRLDSRDSDFWRVAALLLSGGSVRYGSCAGGQQCSVFFPSWMDEYPVALDRDGHGVVAKQNVPFRGSPRQDAPVVAMLSYEIVTFEGGTPSEGGQEARWTRVGLLDGRSATSQMA